MAQPIKNVVIVGGGTAGWMTAASLARYFSNQQANITLVESTAIGTVGVGEATIPGIVEFNHSLGINEVDFIKATNATFKLGIKFENWRQLDSHFFHPFADYGLTIDNVEFHQYVNRLKAAGEAVNLEDYCFAIALAKQGKFAQPHPQPPSPLADYSYAYHFDAGLYAEFLKRFSLDLGVTHKDANVKGVNLNPASGFIDSITCEDGETIGADLFVDCTGFKGLLIEDALGTGYEDWSHWLYCDRALAVQTELVGEPTPYTRSIARANGWQWRIPLQHRMGNGYIYSSRYEQDEHAEQLLVDNIEGKMINQIRKFRFQPGRRKQIWNKNCIAIGLSSGFLEPLESTSISLIQSAITKLLNFFPDSEFNPHDIAEVNRLHNEEMEHIRDFLILHYKLSQRDDSDFWRACQNMDIPDTLASKIGLYKSRGHIAMYDNDSFEPASWLTMYNAFQCKPQRHDVRAEAVPADMIKQKLQQMKQSLVSAANGAMTHQEFISKHCKSNM